MLLGAHVPASDPLAAARDRDAEVVQVFLSSPRQWAPPQARPAHEELAAGGLPVFVHSPYLLNPASASTEVRERSLTLLQATCERAAAVGALGVVVHGGQVGAGEDLALGHARWRACLRALETSVPVLLEDTAGGPQGLATSLERIDALWSAISDTDTPIGFCLDTCHLYAAGEDLVAGTRAVMAVVGRIDLVHVNDSKDPVGSGRDRHANLGEGTMDPDALAAAVRLADAPAVVETPGGAEAQAADVGWLRARL